MNILKIELAIANYFGIREHLIVPNVSWGLGIHEVDLLVITNSGFAWEIEIKTSIADLKADMKKTHNHFSDIIRRLYFAIPVDLKTKAIDFIPQRAGLLIVDNDGYVSSIKPIQENRTARKLTQVEIEHLGRLASMRIWTLKRKLYDRIKVNLIQTEK